MRPGAAGPARASHRNVARNAELRQRILQDFCFGRNSNQPARDLEIFDRREIVFHRRRVAQVDDLARVFFFQRTDFFATPTHFAFTRREQAAQDAQQAGLAAAVDAGNAQPLAGGEGKAKRIEQRALLAHALQADRFQHAALLQNR